MTWSTDSSVQQWVMHVGKTARERLGGWADGPPWVRKSGSNGARLSMISTLLSYGLSRSPQNFVFARVRKGCLVCVALQQLTLVTFSKASKIGWV